MGTKLIVAIVAIVIVVLAVGGLAVGSRNSLFAKKENLDAKWAEVQVQLQRRADLIPQLVSVVQGALTQEQVVFGQIANARAGLTQAMQGGSRQQVIDADNQLTSALGRINFLSITEAYPELKSNESIVGLQKQIEGTENRLNVARGDYNKAVQDYNTTRGTFPAVLVAGLFGYEREDAYFKSQPGAENAPKIDLNQQNRAPAPAAPPAPAPAR